MNIYTYNIYLSKSYIYSQFRHLNFMTVNYRFYRTSKKSHLKLTPILEEIIIGTILGDMSVEKAKPLSNARLQFKQSTENMEYILHLYSLFEEYCGTAPREMSSYDNRPNKNKIYSSIKFQTLSLPCFNIYKELFYKTESSLEDGKLINRTIKIIPVELINLITARSLAYWIMDDGYKSNKGLYLCTESFNYQEQNILINILKTKFDLNCGIHKVTNGHRIYIQSTSIARLKELVTPYFIEHFLYKLDIN